MSQEILIVGIVFASIILIVFLGVLGGMFKTWVDRNSQKNPAENQEFLAALREFKEKTEQRLSNLEAIVVDEEEPVSHKTRKKELPEKEQKSAIELEIENEEKKESEKQGGKLRNMLNH